MINVEAVAVIVEMSPASLKAAVQPVLKRVLITVLVHHMRRNSCCF